MNVFSASNFRCERNESSVERRPGLYVEPEGVITVRKRSGAVPALKRPDVGVWRPAA